MWQVLRILTAGESHGAELSAVLEGIPAQVPLSLEKIQQALRARQSGFGRSGRMKLEEDEVLVTGGITQGKTTGAPIAIRILNGDQSFLTGRAPVTIPRPGHADLAAGQKFSCHDLGIISERASARETACRVALGAIAQQFLAPFGIRITGRVTRIGKIISKSETSFAEGSARVAESELRCDNSEAEIKMREAIKEAAKLGDTLGGCFQIAALGVVPGLGNYISWEKRLDARIGAALLSIPAIKGFEMGIGFSMAEQLGSQVHDTIYFHPEKNFYRETNHAGGIEGGVSNGEIIWGTCAMKPLPTLRAPLSSVDIVTKLAAPAPVSRADICAVPAACVVGEAMMALVIADALLEKFGGDSLEETKRNYESYCTALRQY